jgi:hypothetical protein
MSSLPSKKKDPRNKQRKTHSNKENNLCISQEPQCKKKMHAVLHSDAQKLPGTKEIAT